MRVDEAAPVTGRGGFSVHVGEPIAPEQQHLEDAAAYFVRDPPALKKLVYLDGREGRRLPLTHGPLERNFAMDHRVTSMTTRRGRAAGAGIGFDSARQRD